MDESVWSFVEAMAGLDGDAGVFLAYTVKQQVSTRPEPLTERAVLDLLEDLRSPLPLEEAMTLLNSFGLLPPPGQVNQDPPKQLVIGSEAIDLDRLRAETPAHAPSRSLDAWQVTSLLRRSHDWAAELSREVHRRRLTGVPTFWQCLTDSSGSTLHEPLARAVGSMASLDLLALWAETARGDDVIRSDSAIEWLLGQSLAMQDLSDTQFRGGLYLRQFDDDFVQNYEPAKGSYPNIVATANACSVWIHYVHVVSDMTPMSVRIIESIESALHFIGKAQRPDGSWALATGDYLDVLEPDALAMRFAVIAMTDALSASFIKNETHESCKAALARAAEFLRATTVGSASCWNYGFAESGAEDRRAETTALLLDPLIRLADSIDCHLIDGATDYVWKAYIAKGRPKILEVEFRVPAWTGVASQPVKWELPFGALVATSLLCRASFPQELSQDVQAIFEDLVRSEIHGHWYDLRGLEKQKRMAFPSNSLINVRALRTWAVLSLEIIQGAFPQGTVSAANRPLV